MTEKQAYLLSAGLKVLPQIGRTVKSFFPAARGLTGKVWRLPGVAGRAARSGVLAAKNVAGKAKGVASGVGQTANRALGSYRQAIGATPGRNTVAETVRHMAGVPMGGKFFQRGQTLKNVKNFLTSPQYPGLDPRKMWRAPAKPIARQVKSIPRQVSRLFRPRMGSAFSSRPATMTRGMAGTGLRRGSQAVGAGSLAAAALQSYHIMPEQMAGAMNRHATAIPIKDVLPTASGDVRRLLEQLPPDTPLGEAREQLGLSYDTYESLWRNAVHADASVIRRNLPSLASEQIQNIWGGGEQSAIADAHGEGVRRGLIPYWRNELYRARKSYPKRMAALDAIRSLTPGGALLTAGLRGFSSPEPPDTEGIVADMVEKYGPDVLRNIDETDQSLYTKLYRQMISPEQLGALTARQSTNAVDNAVTSKIRSRPVRDALRSAQRYVRDDVARPWAQQMAKSYNDPETLKRMQQKSPEAYESGAVAVPKMVANQIRSQAEARKQWEAAAPQRDFESNKSLGVGMLRAGIDKLQANADQLAAAGSAAEAAELQERAAWLQQQAAMAEAAQTREEYDQIVKQIAARDYL